MSGKDKKYMELLQKTAGLTANQRLIVMLYALLAPERDGTVRKTAAQLAALLNLSPTVFSRLRRQMITDGWLEEGDKLGHIRYYRLSPKATGH